MKKEEKKVWRNLKDNNCPKCAFRLFYQFSISQYSCPNNQCDFKISEEAFNRVIGNMYSTKPREQKDEYMDNLEYLNNL